MNRDKKTKILAFIALFAILFSVVSTGLLIIVQTLDQNNTTTPSKQFEIGDIKTFTGTAVESVQTATGTTK